MSGDINEYFSKFTYDPLPENGSPPDEKVWKDVGVLRVKGNRLCIGDSWGLGYDSVYVDVPPGEYQVTAECFAYGTDGRVARLRIQLQGSKPDGEEVVGEFGVDVASAGVSDGDLLDRYAEASPDEHEEWVDSFVDNQTTDFSIAGTFPHKAAGTVMYHISTGFGDGVYPVKKLLEKKKSIGAEAVFLQHNQGYMDVVD